MDTNLKVMLNQLKSDNKVATFVNGKKSNDGIVKTFNNEYIILNTGLKINVKNLKAIKVTTSFD